MKISKARILNLTTGILHTDMDDIYKDVEYLTGEKMWTHMLPAAVNAIRPILAKQLPQHELKFYLAKKHYKTGVESEVEIRPFNKEEKAQWMEAYKKSKYRSFK